MNRSLLTLVAIAAFVAIAMVPVMSDGSDAEETVFTIDVQQYADGGTIHIDPDVTKIRLEGDTSNSPIVSYMLTAFPDWIELVGPVTWEGVPQAGTWDLTVCTVINLTERVERTLTLIINQNVTFYANGGHFSDSTDTMSLPAAGSISLPAVERDGHTMLGWYTSAGDDGDLVGMPGSYFTPTSGQSYYAHWGPSALVIEPWTVYGNQGLTFEHSPEVRDANGDIVDDFTIKFNSSKSAGTTSDCVVAGSDTISVNLYGLLPKESAYIEYFDVTATFDGEVHEGEWVVYIYQSVFVIDDPEETLEVGDTYRDSIPVKPDNAVIESYTVQLDGKTASQSYYEFTGTTTTNVTFTAEKAGSWVINLRLTAPGISSDYNYTIRLNYTEAEEPEPGLEPPEISDIDVVKVEGAGTENTYTFYVDVIGTVSSIEWDFGDGSYATGNNKTHVFRDIGEHEVTCTVRNSAGSDVASCTVTASDVVENPDFRGQANINSEYKQEFYIDSANAEVEITGTDASGAALAESRLSWLEHNVVPLDGKYAMQVIGTCTDVTMAGSTVHVHIECGDDVWDWDIVILAEVEDPVDSNEGDAKYVANGLHVTLTDIYPNNPGITLTVNWGDGSRPDYNGSSATFEHDYPTSGTWDAELTWRYNTTQFTIPLVIEVEGAPAKVVYIGGEGAEGTMADQTGRTSYEVLECGFTNGGKTFLGWNSAADFTGTVFMPGDTVYPDGELKLYAMWSGAGDGGSSGGWDILAIVGGVVLVILIVVLVTRYML